ncbi:MAG: AMP-binding protein, partial [Planctomycetota bacterium]|nr:AMP-binding protein [Planctomycetota bacterium]
MSAEKTGQIDNVMQENRLFSPSAEFQSQSLIASPEAYQELYDKAAADLPAFWSELARQEIHWFEPFETGLKRDPEQPQNVEWFPDGKTNASYNCLDANLEKGLGDKVAILWEGEPGDQRTLTYSELHQQVCKFANVLKALGVSQGDVVSIYMPMTPELAIAMLACARVGAIHSVIFAGFSAEAIADRNN